MRRILCFIFFLPIIRMHSPDTVTASVKYVPLGSTITIPCEGYAGHNIAKWMYKRTSTFEVLANEDKGLILYKTPNAGKKVLNNFSLQISDFSDLNEGIYYCEVCTQQCTDGEHISLISQYGKFCPAVSRQFIIKGDNFRYSCLHGMSLKLRWTFEAHGQNTDRPVKREQTDNSVLLISDVQPSDAGKYSCWRETSANQSDKVCSVALCVLTVTDMELSDSPQNCTLYCDMDIDAEKRPLVVNLTDKWNISIMWKVNNPKHSVSCSLHHSSAETNRGSIEDVTLQSDIAAMDNSHSTSSQTAVFISVFTAVLFITIIIFGVCLWLLKKRPNADTNSGHKKTTRCSKDEDELHVIYSTLEIGGGQHKNVRTPESKCVYSTIKAYEK